MRWFWVFDFGQRIDIKLGSPMDDGKVWPHNVDICITRMPIRKRDGYDKNMIEEFAKRLRGSMTANGLVFLICYAPMEDKGRPFEIASIMKQAGFNHVDNIVVERSWLPGKRSESNLVNSHDYVLFFCNGKVWTVDRLPIQEYLGMNDSVSCPGNTWKVETGSLDEAYPIDLAQLLVTMADQLPGSMVFDPFMGAQSGLMAAVNVGHSFVGFEKDARRLKRYEKYIEKMYKEGKI